MEAVIDVDGIAYCSLHIEGASVPPTMNFVDTIYIQDGFAMAVPVLQLVLNDSLGTLSADMNLQDGTLITIKLGKDRSKVKSRKFRVYSYKKETTAQGPHLVVTAILDCPKWISGVYTESFQGSSSSVLQQVASKSGLKFDGPKGTDDSMVWLNVNKNRAAFSEDVALRGYSSKKSCMYRILTMDKELRYKDLFDVLKESPKYSFLQNVETGAATGKPIIVRETQDGSVSGFPTHFNNYGQKQYEHSLDAGGQKSTESLSAPVLGNALPINEDVRSEIKDRGARISYTGWDTGTEPKKASNLHRYYEPAMYQNLRYYGLFSERLTVLSDMYTDASTFDCADYKHTDHKGSDFKHSSSLEGKWLIGGKTVWIKAGHKYSEIFYLYRPTIMEGGSSNSAGSASPSSGAPAKANAGKFDMASNFNEMPNEFGGKGANAAPKSPDITSQAGNPAASKPKVPAAKAASDSLAAMSKFADAVPLIPDKATTDKVDPAAMDAQNELRSALNDASSTSIPEIKDALTPKPGDLSSMQVMKKYESKDMEKIANNPTTPIEVVSTGMDRVSTNGSQLKTPIRNVVPETLDGIVGDVGKGGVWTDALNDKGVDSDNLNTDLTKVKDYLPKAQIVHDLDSAGFGSTTVTITPSESAKKLKEWAENTTPEKLLMEQGSKVYIDAFGYDGPEQARKTLEDIKKHADEVEAKYSAAESIVDNGADVNKFKVLFGDSALAPIVDVVDEVKQIGPAFEVSTKKKLIAWSEYHNLGFTEEGWKFPFVFPRKLEVTLDVPNKNNTTNKQSFIDWELKK